MVLVTSETTLVAPRREFVGEKECRLLEWRAELHLWLLLWGPSTSSRGSVILVLMSNEWWETDEVELGGKQKMVDAC